MSFNLPPSRLLKVTKGNWAEVQYPVNAMVRANLTPQDFFEPVDQNSARSCIPAGGKNFHTILNSNTGAMTLHGETMFEPMSVEFIIDNGAWQLFFVGRVMQAQQVINAETDIDQILTNFEYTLPALLSVPTGLSIYAETVELALGEHFEARAETLVPPNAFQIFSPDYRNVTLQYGIDMLPVAANSAKFTLASSYLREALFLDAPYFGHNPYTLSLLVILKCAQAIEILFTTTRDAIRAQCRSLGIPDQIIESQIIPIVLARNELASAHVSSFMPTLREADIIRHFSKRSVNTVRQLLLHISRIDPQKRTFLFGPARRDPDKERLVVALEQSIKSPEWLDVEVEHVVSSDPRFI